MKNAKEYFVEALISVVTTLLLSSIILILGVILMLASYVVFWGRMLYPMVAIIVSALTLVVGYWCIAKASGGFKSLSKKIHRVRCAATAVVYHQHRFQ